MEPKFKGGSIEDSELYQFLKHQEWNEELLADERVQRMEDAFKKRWLDFHDKRNDAINKSLVQMVDGVTFPSGQSILPAPTNNCDNCIEQYGEYHYTKETLLHYMKIAFDMGQLTSKVK